MASTFNDIGQKAGKGHIDLQFEQKNDVLSCLVEDDGIGVEAGKENGKEKKRKSLGIELTKERLSIPGRQKRVKAGITIGKRFDEEGKTAGTWVEMRIPFEME